MTEGHYWNLIDQLEHTADKVFYNGDEGQIDEMEEDLNDFIVKWSKPDGDA